MQSIRRKFIQVILYVASLTNPRDYHKLTYYYYAESYVNFNELVTDLFKQYKVNPAGMAQVPPPSAIGPGAIMNSQGSNTPLAVGPGFGSIAHRPRHQYGRFIAMSWS
jgi:hypothetical protein